MDNLKNGHIPHNKGKKWIEYLDTEAIEKLKQTRFKKGNIPVKTRTVGSERINIYGYTEIKVGNPKKWELKHRYIYEKEHGEIPKGYKVIFADGNKQNFKLDNLILVSSAELLTINRNKLIKQNAELTKTGVLIAKVMNKAEKRRRTNEQIPKQKSNN